jgi:hypothetical protein
MHPRWARDVLLAVAAGRIAIGTAALLRPQLLRSVVGGGALGARAEALTRMVGVRDLALGAGALLAAPRADVAVLLGGLGAVADAGDALASVIAAGAFDADRRRRWLLQAGVAGLSATAAGGAALAARAARRR